MALDATSSQMRVDRAPPNSAPARRWNRGVAIRFFLAITPTVTFAIIGAIEQHLTAH
jgi:hypothetical protein